MVVGIKITNKRAFLLVISSFLPHRVLVFPLFHMCHFNFEMMQMVKSMFSISRRFRGNFKLESKIPGEENILLENDEVKLEFSGASGLLKVNRKIDRCLTLSSTHLPPFFPTSLRENHAKKTHVTSSKMQGEL